MEECSRAIPGARRLDPRHFDGLGSSEKRQDIVDRVKYLVRGERLEEPPHILRARLTLAQAGKDWGDASEEEICDALSQQSKPLFESGFWEMGSAEYDTLTGRIYQTQLDYYGLDHGSASGIFLNLLRDDPGSSFLCQRLKQTGTTIKKIIHFTRQPVEDKHRRLAFKVKEKRGYFFDDVAFLQAIQEADLKPAVIMKEFMFWKDGADQDAEALERSDWLSYNTTHWLTEHYDVDVCSGCPGSGFVTCRPTIYIRKGTSLVYAFKTGLRRASTLLSRSGTN
ncbi:predicted protein [Chaetomium globosum CBS 148.51]|uniref:Uncharacterized protein n=1 Tax=Chaetomium globosum (strain ATCC 6205 / CBS 148.51 / DSM 1962 / NBRC 6347 / NRRL 1970) TaxID=306901 RepID=Q2GPK9_CHAGB|nr:uncharacterized protein CHGG_10095 [Chaetomium globosum CBS 148.51]EAQ83691.1 predicted protein [Chaetomium globosum CBS 148.51]